MPRQRGRRLGAAWLCADGPAWAPVDRDSPRIVLSLALVLAAAQAQAVDAHIGLCGWQCAQTPSPPTPALTLFPSPKPDSQKRDGMTAGKIVDNWLEHQGTKDQLPPKDFVALNKVRPQQNPLVHPRIAPPCLMTRCLPRYLWPE